MINFLAVDCGPPPSVDNGFHGTPNRTTFEGTVTYSCDDTYILSQSGLSTCLANGVWDTPPDCLGKHIGIAGTWLVLVDLMHHVIGRYVQQHVLTFHLSTMEQSPTGQTSLPDKKGIALYTSVTKDMICLVEQWEHVSLIQHGVVGTLVV